MVVGMEDMARLGRAAHARAACMATRAGCLAAREAAERIVWASIFTRVAS